MADRDWYNITRTTIPYRLRYCNDTSVAWLRWQTNRSYNRSTAWLTWPLPQFSAARMTDSQLIKHASESLHHAHYNAVIPNHIHLYGTSYITSSFLYHCNTEAVTRPQPWNRPSYSKNSSTAGSVENKVEYTTVAYMYSSVAYYFMCFMYISGRLWLSCV